MSFKRCKSYRRGKANRNPLRKVVHRGFTEAGVEVEDLECGHRIHVREDFVGPTNATRRRCHHCGKAERKVEATP